MKQFDELLKYEGRILNTDEYSEAYNLKNKLLKELEDLNWKHGEDYLLLKWGTIKGIDFKNEKAKELLKKYNNIGVSGAGVIMQEDTQEQKNIIVELIELCDGVIQNDWTGDYMTKDEAKKYVLEYN